MKKLIEWFKKKTHTHDRDKRYERILIRNGDICIANKYVCSCGFVHEMSGGLLVTKEDLDDAFDCTDMKMGTKFDFRLK